MSFEGHPNNTTREHLQKLYDLGFRRVSFGVQSYSETVQKAINRIQPFENVAKVTYLAREIGYTSISHDLIYGLPFQTLGDIYDTIEKTKSLFPDRLAFYSYAHMPWIKGNGQRGFKDEDVPKDEQKNQMSEEGKQTLDESGCPEIGMDHFAIPEDAMTVAFQEGNLHRNFMGYSTSKTQLMVGLGVSAISDSWYGFGQNVKNFDDYYLMLEWDKIPVNKGHILTEEHLTVRKHIINVMRSFQTTWNSAATYFDGIKDVLPQLKEFKNNILLEFSPNGMHVTEKGKAFASCLYRVWHAFATKTPERPLLSKTVQKVGGFRLGW
jgi:oxygen-independent coproporphyrinogen-3 oxidase